LPTGPRVPEVWRRSVTVLVQPELTSLEGTKARNISPLRRLPVSARVGAGGAPVPETLVEGAV